MAKKLATKKAAVKKSAIKKTTLKKNTAKPVKRTPTKSQADTKLSAPKRSLSAPCANQGEALHEHFHKDGSLWARGEMSAGVMHGYWEWFRKDGTRLRSGHFEQGAQTGEWITYDKQGAIYKITMMKTK